MSEPILDKAGQEIKSGCIIVYGHALGRCAGLRFGKVLAAKSFDNGKNHHITECNTDYRITVWGIDDDWAHRGPNLLSKKSTLMFPDRILVLTETQVKPEIKALLDTVQVPPQ